MIIANQFIFVHNPKTGGQALAAAIGGRCCDVDLHCPLSAIEPEGRFTFGTVRNPWGRMVSLYRFLCRKRVMPGDMFDQAKVRALGFERWLCEDEFFLLRDYQTMEPVKPMQRRSQRYWLEGADAIIRFERLERDAQAIAGRLGIRWRGLRTINAAPKPVDCRAAYGVEAHDHVARWFAWEIAEFGYEF